MEIGEEKEPVEVPFPMHPDEIPADAPAPARAEPEKVPA